MRCSTFVAFALLLVVGLHPSRTARAQPALPAFSFQTNQLPATLNLPDDFELFVPDSAAQVLFNPARALQYDGRFVYADHTPASSTRSLPYSSLPTLYGAALLGNTQRKWLLVVGNSVKTSEIRETKTRPVDASSFSQATSSTTSSKSTTARFRLVRIQGNKQRAGALGLFAAYRRDITDYSQRYRRQSFQHVDKSNRRDYVLGGLEYTLTAPTWDWINTITYQKTLNDFDVVRTKREASIDSPIRPPDSSRVEHDLRQTTHSANGSSHPNLIRVSSYYRKQLGWMAKRDYAFVSLTGRYEFGNRSYGFPKRQLASRTVRIWDRRVRGAAGYAVKKRAEALRVFAGGGLSAAYGRSSNIALPLHYSAPANISTEASDLRVALTLPAYLRYALTDRIALFAGGQYVYQLTRRTSEQVQSLSDTIQETQTTYEKKNRKRWQATSSSSIYAGLFASHETGLFVEASFGAQLLDTSQWSVALGYRF